MRWRVIDLRQPTHIAPAARGKSVRFRALLWLMLALSSLMPAACARDDAPGTGTPVPQATPLVADPVVAARQQALVEAEQQWQAQAITHYTMELRHFRPEWGTQVFQVVVADGEVTILAHHCLPVESCLLTALDPAEMTVPFLFTVAHDIAPLRDRMANVRFDQTFGYPREISYDGGFWLIREFQAHN
jgi:hypothetical protein